MASLYITDQGALVHKQGGRLVITKDGKRIREIPAIYIDRLVIFGNVSVTTPALSFLLSEGIDTAYLSIHGRYRGRLVPEYSKNILLRQRQFKKADDPEFCLKFAKSVVGGKALNQRNRCLQILRNRERDTYELKPVFDSLRREIAVAESISALRAVEGAIARRYFAFMKEGLNQELRLEKRVKRLPADPINVLLNFSYGLLKNAVMSALSNTGLDPYLGYYHANKYARPALALDMMEEFRPIIADAVVQGAVNKRVITASHFRIEDSAITLSTIGIKKFLSYFDQKLSTEFDHPYYRYRANYRQCIDLQARMVAKLILGEIEGYYPHVAR